MTDGVKQTFETDPPKEDPFGMGMVDGKVVTLTPEQHAQAALERNAYEGDTDTAGEEADLEEISDEEIADLKAELADEED